ncbi:hypothetical protein TSUD_157790 [Trifolium subterraneum]|uniref:RRM domain-containing protein n=1 Tax=Trifolium subterraneum TaxID=3900 RepID=A0A2Z6N0J7_TRISU|nr:hypothetical protein TSUD_157790 [Trifolium subterraneum]
MRESEERGVGGEGARAQQKGYVHRLDRVATSFFFSNFPEDVQVVDLWPRFARFGRVGDVYIPPRVDKQGKRFGFVKFREVGDAVQLLRSLSNIWIGSFKLRINLSKFQRINDQEQKGDGQKDVFRPHGGGGAYGVGAKSFKQVIGGAGAGDVGEGTSFGGATIGGGIPVSDNKVSEVVWEVEVEEERLALLEGAYVGYLVEDKDVQIIQNNFTMGGFQNLNVSAMGFRMVLLWSKKKEEVKEVVETVGWWCTLFERLIPWSPSLVTNHRTTWIRCFGVPTHAWGNDIFRAVAFKFGRFIEVDEYTKQFKRCDVARIKVVTNALSVVDTSMKVSVLGKIYVIRVIEETEEWFERGGGDRKKGAFWQGDASSRASDEGVSVLAAAEGFSETGSDADVSESCQVLLEIEAHGGCCSVTDDSKGKLGYTEDEMAGIAPNVLGNPVSGEEDKVNFECDKREGNMSEEVEKGLGDVEKVLEDGPIAIVSGDHYGLRKSKGYEEGELTPLAAVVVAVMSTNVGSGCTTPQHVGKRGVENAGEVVGPRILRTKKGDICVGGPVLTNANCTNPPSGWEGVSKGVGSSFGSKAQLVGPKRKILSMNSNRKVLPGKNKHVSNLPYHKLCKLPRAVQELSMSKRRRAPKKKHGEKNVEGGEVGSDSIQNSNGFSISVSAEGQTAREANCEVVSPCPIIEMDGSNLHCDPQQDGLDGREVVDHVVSPIMEVEGAVKLMCIEKEPEVRKRLLMDQIKEIDLKSESRGLSDVDVETRKRLFGELWTLLKGIDASTFQRSRSRWLKEGDANTSYFHARVKARGRKNCISVLHSDSGMVEGPGNVRQATIAGCGSGMGFKGIR